MKMTKMSLVAALLVAGTSAFAIDNVKVSGDARVYYQTADAKAGYAAATKKDDLFGKDNSAADAALNLNVTADLAKNDLVTVSAGAGYTIISTLGLENNFVSNVWAGSHTATFGTKGNFANTTLPVDGTNTPLGGAKVENANWMTEAWVAVSAAKGTKTTLKIGRMELDTPLAFTEKWSIEKNTFEAAVVVNQDIPDTTLVAAYVGNGNGNEQFGQDEKGILSNGSIAGGAVGTPTYRKGVSLAVAPVVNANGKFTTFGTNGAYAVGAVNNSWKPLTVQAWYYDLISLADAYWLQADFSMDGILAGAQYTSVKVKDAPAAALGASNDSSGTYALMVGYAMKDTVTVKVAYSQTSDKGALHGANTATGTGASKLYTEAWWNYGYVTRLDTSAYSVSVESPVNGIVDLGLYYTSADVKADKEDLSEITLTASKSFGPLDATLAYIYTDAEDINAGDAYNTIQAYLTLNF